MKQTIFLLSLSAGLFSLATPKSNLDSQFATSSENSLPTDSYNIVLGNENAPRGNDFHEPIIINRRANGDGGDAGLPGASGTGGNNGGGAGRSNSGGVGGGNDGGVGGKNGGGGANGSNGGDGGSGVRGRDGNPGRNANASFNCRNLIPSFGALVLSIFFYSF